MNFIQRLPRELKEGKWAERFLSEFKQMMDLLVLVSAQNMLIHDRINQFHNFWHEGLIEFTKEYKKDIITYQRNRGIMVGDVVETPVGDALVKSVPISGYVQASTSFFQVHPKGKNGDWLKTTSPYRKERKTSFFRTGI